MSRLDLADLGLTVAQRDRALNLLVDRGFARIELHGVHIRAVRVPEGGR